MSEAKDIKDKTKTLPKEITGNLVKQWFSEGGLDAYQQWLAKQPNSLMGLEELSQTLVSMKQHWADWSGHYAPAKMQAFIAQTIRLCNERLAAVPDSARARAAIRIFLQNLQYFSPFSKSTKVSPQTQSYAIDELLSRSAKLFASEQSSVLYGQFDPGLCFDLLGRLNSFQHLSIGALSARIQAMGSLAQSHAFYTRVIDSSGQLKTFRNQWHKWLGEVEQRLGQGEKLSGRMACQCLAGFAALVDMQCLTQPFKAATINKLLASLLKEPTDQETVRDGLGYVVSLVAWQAITDIAALFPADNTNLAGRLIEGPAEKKTLTTSQATHNEAAFHLSYLWQQINAVSSKPKAISAQALQRLLARAVNSNSPQSMSQILLLVGQILQASQQSGQEANLQKIAEESIAKLNAEEVAANLSLTEIAHALYALVLPEAEVWCNIGPTENLIKYFCQKLNNELNRGGKASHAVTVAVQQVAEYLGVSRSEQAFPKPIADYLQNQEPVIDEHSLQSRFRTYLKKQAWFKQRYEFLAQKGREEELRFGFVQGDYVIEDKQTSKDNQINDRYQVEVDGYKYHYHNRRLRPQNQRRDKYLRKLKDQKSQHPLFKEIIRLPVESDTKLEDMEYRLYQQLTRQASLSVVSETKKNDIKKKPITVTESSKKIRLEEQEFKSKVDQLASALHQSVANLEDKKEQQPSRKTKPQYPVSIEGLRQAIKAQDSHGVIQLTNLLKNRNTFKSDQEKADLLMEAVSSNQGPDDKASQVIIKNLITLGQRIITTDYKGQSPLTRAVELGNTTVIDLFIASIIPEKFQDQSWAFYPFWQQALKLAEKKQQKGIAQRLKTAGVVLFDKTTPLMSAPLTVTPSSAPLKPATLEDKKNLDEKLSEVKALVQQTGYFADFGFQQYKDPQWREQLEILARNNDAVAQYFLAGLFYDLANNKLTDPENFFYWLKLSAAQRYALAQTSLGIFYIKGIDIPQNIEEGIKLLESATQRKEPRAQGQLAACYQYGIGVVKDEEKAARYYRLAAEQGNANAQKQLGVCYEDGIGVSRDMEKALEWNRLAAESGMEEAQLHLGTLYEERGGDVNLREAARWYRQAAEQGAKKAQFLLGDFYETGRGGLPRDLKEAFNCYHQAAKQNMKDALAKLGECYEKGRGIEPSIGKAVQCYRLAARQGDLDAQYNLALCYLQNDIETVPESKFEAVQLLQDAGQKGFVHAKKQLEFIAPTICLLAQQYEGDTRWDRHIEKAIELYQIAHDYLKEAGLKEEVEANLVRLSSRKKETVSSTETEIHPPALQEQKQFFESPKTLILLLPSNVLINSETPSATSNSSIDDKNRIPVGNTSTLALPSASIKDEVETGVNSDRLTDAPNTQAMSLCNREDNKAQVLGGETPTMASTIPVEQVILDTNATSSSPKELKTDFWKPKPIAMQQSQKQNVIENPEAKDKAEETKVYWKRLDCTIL